jgi:uncharacterized protein
MQVKIDKQYAIAASIDAAWQVLGDIREVASCMPGAEITEQLEPTHYKGNMKVKVGPASAVFGGEIEVLSLDPAAKRMHFKGKGAERSGSTAAMDLTAALLPGESPNACVLQGNAEMIVSGKFAQFGGRMMSSVADVMLERFVQTFSQKAAALSAPAVAEETHVSAGQAAQPAAKPEVELNALTLLWEAIKRFFSGLLHSRK